MTLDRLRGQAKHAAWYDHPDDPRTYNPFGKTRSGFIPSQNQMRNTENGDGRPGLTQSMTDQEDQHTDVLGRQADTNAALGGPAKSNTAPALGRRGEAPGRGNSSYRFSMNGATGPVPEKSKLNTDSSLASATANDSKRDPDVTNKDPSSSNNPRQQQSPKGIFNRSREVSSEEPEAETPKPHYTFGNQIRAALFNSWINVLLLTGKYGPFRLSFSGS
jgi:Ca2+:H+ antiporter